MSLLELAERCEQATGPDHRLDGEILVAVRPDLAGTLRAAAPVHRYTASLDAAMTLAPVEMQVSVLLDAINACCSDGDDWLRDLPRFVCAAALRARAAILQEQPE